MLSLAGCASHQIGAMNFSEIRTDMAGLNKHVKGFYYNNINKDLSTLTKEHYLSITKEKQDSSEKEYFEFLKDQKPELEFRSSKSDFIVCIKAVKVKIILCDIASTGLTDFDSADMTIDISEKINSFKLK